MRRAPAQTLKKVSDRFKKHGAKFDLRVMATHGGTISRKAKSWRAPSSRARSAG
jgi:N-methylhydantoinase A/oxoprolinase/acetone carboxylase beta subunit